MMKKLRYLNVYKCVLWVGECVVAEIIDDALVKMDGVRIEI